MMKSDLPMVFLFASGIVLLFVSRLPIFLKNTESISTPMEKRRIVFASSNEIGKNMKQAAIKLFHSKNKLKNMQT
ncbi:hypothetical protein [Sphingobacterium puteale]|uniref:hypothetical protein n=1 Tax=Sphingobacterium puteale TaxID=2420510 RepID=UPI003D95B86F